MQQETWQEREAREDAHQAMCKQKLQDVATAIGFKYVAEGGDIELQNPKHPEQVLCCWIDHDHQKITFTGRLGDLQQFHDTNTWGGHQPDFYPRIGVSSSRKAVDIASDVAKRLLPGYRVLLKELAVRKDAHDAKERSIDDLAASIARAGNTTWHEGDHSQYHDRLIGLGSRKNGSGEPTGTARVNGLGGVYIELRNLTPELAQHIAAIMGEYVE
jgi:hypothetical protein